MIQINKVGNAIVIEFTDNDKYLFNGTIEVAPNELMVVVDQSNMVTFKKMSNGDTLFGQSYEKIRINDEPVTKENIVEKFATIGFTSGGGGGTGGAVDSVNGQTGTVIITASSIGAITKETADATYQPIGDYAVKSDLSTLATKTELNTKLDTSVYEVDKANFATKEELNSKADASAIADMATKTWVGEQGYLTEIPSEYVTDSELTEALADKADKTGAEFTGTIAAPIVAFMRESQGMMGAIQADSNNILFRTYNAGVKSITFQVQNTAALKLTEAGIWENNQLLENKYAQLSDLNDFATTEQLNTKQDTLVSGTNIKTINGQTLLGEGNIEIQGGGTIIVDSALSTDSENPVQNKVITNALNDKASKTELATKQDSINKYVSSITPNPQSTGFILSTIDINAEGEPTITSFQLNNTKDPDIEFEADRTNPAEPKSYIKLSANVLKKAVADQIYATKTELEGKVDDADIADMLTKSEAASTYQPKGEYATTSQLSGKQDTLVSGTNIKTVNGNSLLGEGDITIQSGGTVDTAMSDTSENAVQNKVIKKYIDDLVGNILTQLQEINGTN